MDIKDFVKLYNSGEKLVIKMKDNIYEHAEESFDPEMMGRVIDVRKEYDDGYRLLVDMNGYEKHNKSVAQYDWRDSKGELTLSWFDTKYYPKDGIEALHIPLEGEAPFEVVNHYLFSNYLKSKTDETYVEFLENVIFELRDEIKELRNNY